VAYLTSTFARPSDTFIRNEVNQLRRLGVDVITFSIRRPALDGDSEEDVRSHQSATEYLLEAGAGAILFRAAAEAIAHPLRLLRTARLAWQTAAPGLRGNLLQAAYLVEALYLASRIRNRRIELLHNHIAENSATVAMLASEFSGIPFSQTVHGPYIFYAPQKWALGKKLEKAVFTACISDFCRSQCLMFSPEAAWPRLHVVRCSVLPEFTDVPTESQAPPEPHFVCVGRLCTEKGQFVLLEAAHRLATTGRKFRISLVGDGPSRPEIEKCIRDKHLQLHVQVLGWRSSQKIRELLTQSTALVIPSFAEGLPIVAMESLAMRRPVVATNIAAMSELVENGRSGWLIAPGSVDQLVGAMKCACETPWEQLATMGEQGRKRVLEMHDPVRQTEKLRELFLSVPTSPASGGGNPRRD
jgi:glycosyltransferase involved in cell wall biosynthesis